MRFWGPAVISFLLALGPARADVSLPPVEDRLKLYEQQLIAKAAQDTRPSIELLRQVRDAIGVGKTNAAIDALEILAGKHNGQGEGGFGTWLKLALVYQNTMTNEAKRVAVSDGTAAAYGAYKRASADLDRIAALSALGSLLLQAAALDESDEEPVEDDEAGGKPPADKENREPAREMAYTVFTELGRLVADDRYQATLNKLGPEFRLEKVTYPPRPDQYGSDSNPCSEVVQSSDEEESKGEEQAGAEEEVISASKAQCQDNRAHYACLVFTRGVGLKSDEIAAGISVIRENDAKETVTSTYPALVQDKNVCYSLEFGASYKFVIQQGFKSASGEPLRRRTVALLNMPNKGALLGFKRGTYVLPKMGERTITINAVNVVGAKLMLRRIGDLNIVREILLNHVVGGLGDDSEESCFVLNKMGEGIADGSVHLEVPEAKKNQAIPLGVPINTILEARQKWLTENLAPKLGNLNIRSNGVDFSFKLLGDTAAATASLGSETGVFALFGTVTQPLTDDADTADPDDEEACNERRFAAQWFIITDTGLSLQTSHSNLYVIARSFATAKAIQDARIELISRSGLILAMGTTDAHGVASFPARLGQGTGGNELVAVMAYTDKDFAFLDKTASQIDLADRGFEGGSGPAADVDAFIAPIRGIYRPGELVEGLVLIRDLNGEALAKLPPFVLQLVEADGGAVLATQAINPEGNTQPTHATIAAEKGAYRFSMKIPEQVRQGMAKLVVSVGGREAGSTNTIEIRYFQPYTVAVKEREGSWAGEINEQGIFTLRGDARADYLYGQIVQGKGTDAPAAGLAVEYEARLVPAKSPTPHCFEDFTFGHGASDYRPELFAGTGLATAEDGSIHIELVPSRLTQAQVDIPLIAEVTIKVLDANAVAATQKIDVPVKRVRWHWIGAKVGGPQILAPGQSEPNATTQPSVIQIVALDPDGMPKSQNIPTVVSRLNNAFVWSFDGRSWDYVPDPGKGRTKVKDLTLAYDAKQAPNSCAQPMVASVPLGETGNYLLELQGKGSVTELAVHNGWTTAPDGSLEPDSLLVWVPKKEFAKGETIEIGVDTPYRAGTVLGELIANGTLYGTFEGEIDKNGRANATVTVDDKWPQGAIHVYVTALRKADATATEPGPARAIGGTLIRIGHDRGDATLSIKAPSRIQTLLLKDLPQVEVAVDGLDNDAWIELAVVDEGILSVTHHQTPSPIEHFFGRRWFDLQVFDTYGRLLFGKFGGDGLTGLRGMAYQPTDLVAWLSPIRKVENGRVKFTIPLGQDGVPANFQGEIRLMAWAWDDKNFAVAEHHIDVRDPIVVQLSAPPRMAPGDLAIVPLRVSAVDKVTQQQVSIEARVADEGPLSFADNVAGTDAGEACDNAPSLNQCRRYMVAVEPGGAAALLHLPIKANSIDSAAETGNIELAYNLSDTPVARSWGVQVRTPYPPVAIALRRKELGPNDPLTIDQEYFKDIAGSMDANSLVLTARIAKKDLLPAPDGDGAGAASFPLNQDANSAQLILANRSLNMPEAVTPDGKVPSAERLAALAREMLLLQGEDGAFASSPKPGVRYVEHEGVQRDDEQPDSTGQTAFALDILSRVNAIAPTTGDAAVNRAVGFLLSELNRVSSTDDYNVRECTRSDLYAADVLVKLNRMGSGFLQRLSDACAKAIESDPVGKLMLASAFKGFGLPKEADKLAAGIDSDVLAASGAAPADIARALALYTENQPTGSEPILMKISDSPMVMDEATQSWWARAQAALLKTLQPDAVTFTASDAEITPLGVDTVSFPFGIDIQRLRLKEVKQAPVTIVNRGDVPLNVSFLGEGIPTNLEKLGSPSYTVKLNILGRDGPISPTDGSFQLKQFETVYCVVAINQKKDGYTAPQHLAAVQILPTGFEVVDEYYKWSWEKAIGQAVSQSAVSVIDYSETRPDRWIALPRSKQSGNETQLLAFSLRPTLQGEFELPPLVVRDLDNPIRAGWTSSMKVRVGPAK